MLRCAACGKFIWRRHPHCPHCRGARQVVPRLLLLLMFGLLVVGFVVEWLGMPTMSG
jgi:rubredoxin-like zinc ribbon protein